MFNCTGPCAPRNPVAETVKISMPLVINEQVEENRPNMKEEEEVHKRREEEVQRQQQEAERLRLEQEAEQARLEEQIQREHEEAEEKKRRELEEIEERKRRELEEALDKNRLALEEAAQAEAARQAEVEQRAREQERKALIASFLKEHGYNGVGIPKKTMLKTKYPIHTAAKTGDLKIVTALIEEGANPAQKNSAGQTAMQIAQLKNKKGSHANVLRALGGA